MTVWAPLRSSETVCVLHGEMVFPPVFTIHPAQSISVPMPHRETSYHAISYHIISYHHMSDARCKDSKVSIKRPCQKIK